jgi:peptidoglycan-associated lipoprotein
MLETASSLSTQAQALSQDTERLRAKAAIDLPGLAPLPSSDQAPKLVEAPVALVPEKEVERLPSLKAVGKKKEEKSPLDDVFFDLDQSLLTEEAQKILQKNAEWLRSHPQLRILIEGHCDERGTVEYNLALGERRAQSAKDYLANLGISADRISVISYGKEKPFVVGHSEEAWAQNRRAHFLLQSP